ncbi:MAG: CPBP family intramembrane glutamic endopeptidase [Bacteroidota bacterium]
MPDIQQIKDENSPFVQLLLLGVYAIAGLFVLFVIALLLVFFRHGMEGFTDLSWLNGAKGNYISDLKIVLSAQQLGFFLVPALLLAITERKRQHVFYGLGKPKIEIVGLVFLLMLVSAPLMEWVNIMNQKMVLPEFLKSVEQWMRLKEDEGIVATQALLKMKDIPDLLVNTIVIALIPAVCEEFIFRGALQRTFLRWFKNPHLAIWTGAIIFSAIHIQFYGFFPRMLLGATFGYLYFWTGSIWYSVFAHFLNNAYAVCAAFYMQKNNLPMDQESTFSAAWYGYLISAILTLALLKFLKDKRINYEN